MIEAGHESIASTKRLLFIYFIYIYLYHYGKSITVTVTSYYKYIVCKMLLLIYVTFVARPSLLRAGLIRSVVFFRTTIHRRFLNCSLLRTPIVLNKVYYQYQLYPFVERFNKFDFLLLKRLIHVAKKNI